MTEKKFKKREKSYSFENNTTVRKEIYRHEREKEERMNEEKAAVIDLFVCLFV